MNKWRFRWAGNFRKMLQVGDRILKIREDTSYCKIGEFGTVMMLGPPVYVKLDGGAEFAIIPGWWLRVTIRPGDKVVRISGSQPNGCSPLGHEIICPEPEGSYSSYINLHGNKASFQKERWQRVEVAQFYKEQELMNKEGTRFIWTTQQPEPSAAVKITFELKQNGDAIGVTAKHPNGTTQLIGRFMDGKFHRQVITLKIAQMMGIEFDVTGKIKC